MIPPREFVALLKRPGWRWLLYRVYYAAVLRGGLLRMRSPGLQWSEISTPSVQLFHRPSRHQLLDEALDPGAVAEAEAVMRGRFTLFSHHEWQSGESVDWWKNPLASSRGVSAHWTRSGDDGGNDIKGIWELSRFPWAYALVRGWRVARDDRFKDRFWELWESWREQNPPNWGPNWMCGQETTFRLTAVVFAAESFGVSVPNQENLSRFIVASGERIAANLDYAMSQKNNHALSECVGLITAALLVPDHQAARIWRQKGEAELHRHLEELIYTDGSFAQHSVVYHRLMLQVLAWCLHRFQVHDVTPPEWLLEPMSRAWHHLAELVDPATGRAPLTGHNDGSNILPLAQADYLDMRPVLQMSAALLWDRLPLSAGPWDEAAGWLASTEASLLREGGRDPQPFYHAPAGGYALWRRTGAGVGLRCPVEFRHRPAQADVLHVDVWLDGQEIAIDGGSFSYNSKTRFTSLKHAAQHNVLSLPGNEPMRQVSPFLTVPWPACQIEEINADGCSARFDGYEDQGISWHRKVWVDSSGRIHVTDRVESQGSRNLRWHWRLAGTDWHQKENRIWRSGPEEGTIHEVTWSGESAGKCELLQADPDTSFGWRSEVYREVEPASSMVLEMSVEESATMQFTFQTQKES